MLLCFMHSSIEMAFRWLADDGSLIVVFGSSLPSSTKKHVKIKPTLKNLSGSAHAVVVFNGFVLRPGFVI